MATPTPRPVTRALTTTGEHLRRWRLLRGLQVGEVADRAGVSVSTVSRLESGQGASVENLLRVLRALGVMDQMVQALDPLTTDVGRLRAQEQLPKRVRRPREPS